MTDMASIEKITDMGLLTELAYLRLESDEYKTDYSKDYSSENLIDFINKYDIEKTGIKTVDRKDDMIALLQKYEIKDFASDDGLFSSDFQAMLVRDRTSSEYTVVFRGTETKAPFTDWINDIIFAGGNNINLQYNEAKEFVNKVLADHQDISKETLTLAGHSLGGILAQQVGATLHLEGYAYNPYGVDAANNNNQNLTNEREVA